MRRTDILKCIDNMKLREKDYKTMLYMVNRCSPKLFTKIIEEILNGHMFISDFEQIFDEEVSQTISKNISIQSKIERQYKNLLELRQLTAEEININQSLSTTDFANSQRIMSNPIINSDNKKQEILDIKLNYALNFIRKMKGPKELAFQLYELLKINPDFLLLEPYEYNIPFEEENIILDDFDREFMLLNSLTDDEMKKYKALSNFINSKHDWSDD